MALITALQMQTFARGCDYLAVAPALDRACAAAGIDTPREVRHFLAHLHVESAGFTRFVENMNYTAKRMTQVWPNRFPTVESAAPYALKPDALAEKVYGGRMGNDRPGDGARYIGRSPIQITGKAAYARASKWVNEDLVARPVLAQGVALGCRIAANWWLHHGLNEIVAADPGEKAIEDIQQRLIANEMDDVLATRRIIQGGTMGLQEVKAQLMRAGFIWKD